MTGIGWRIVKTITESGSGVAPICGNPIEHGAEDMDVLDCCRGPHIECWSPSNADRVAKLLNEIEAEI